MKVPKGAYPGSVGEDVVFGGGFYVIGPDGHGKGLRFDSREAAQAHLDELLRAAYGGDS